MSPRLSTWLIYPWITDIKITLGDVMKFYLPHQLMQRKSIFIQTGRATYITAMTMQSQGGTTNETKCNYCPPPAIWKQNKPSRYPFWGFKDWDESKPFPCHHSALQLAFLPLFRLVLKLFIMIPISWWLSHHIFPDIDELITKRENYRRCSVIVILPVSHRNFPLSLLNCLVRGDLNQKKDKYPEPP